jgi:phenylacetate-CoA ligase
MSFFQLRTLPGYAWPPLADASISQVWVAYLELERTQWLPPEEIERQQLEQARTLLAHCITEVPYYRAALRAAGIVPGAIRSMDDFRRIPLLARRTYQEKTAQFIAAKLPPGTSATPVTQTSGSSGAPTKVHTTNMTQLWWYALYLRDLQWGHIDPAGTLASIRYSGKTGPEREAMLRGAMLPYWSAPLEPLIVTGPSHGMDIAQDPRVQLQWLRRVAPDYLLSLPANLEALALLAKRDGPIPSLRAIQSIASTLTPETQTLIEGVFGVPVKDLYSCFEAGYLASPCPDGHGLHVHAENVLLEVLDAQGQPCKPGETGRVCITHLHNLRGPFVRYELGDEATLGAACPCGRGLPLLAKVQGKVYPMFHLPKGGVKHCAPLANALRQVGGHWQHQVVQKAGDHVVLRLAVDPTWSEAHADAMTRTLHEFFEAPIRVDLELHDRLAAPASGKFQSMINEMV